jgi:hypothetical protein
LRQAAKIECVKIGRSTIGRMGQPAPAPAADEIQRRRLTSARSCPAWTELQATSLVRRGRRFLVDVSTDRVYVPVGGVIWDMGTIAFGDKAERHFYVDEAGDVQVLERLSGTWSKRTYARERAAAQSR